MLQLRLLNTIEAPQQTMCQFVPASLGTLKYVSLVIMIETEGNGLSIPIINPGRRFVLIL